MSVNRRQFIRNAAIAGAGSTVGMVAVRAGEDAIQPSPDAMGVLTDLTQCIGCRKCEWACNQEPSNDFRENKPMSAFEDQSVFQTHRRHSSDSLTVVNRFEGSDGKPVYVKSQCMHCVDPACLSACLVTAFKKEANGAVSYDSWRCMGCRYCLVACPFQVPSYEYLDPLTPRVRKCTLCFRERTSRGSVPACVEICPVQCMTYGKRSDLIRMARARIANYPDRYISHIYGEHEMGGTSWMYLSGEPFENLGFQTLPDEAPPRLVEGIQHSIFRYFISPILLFGLLSATMWNFKDAGSGGTSHE
ncbi:4Fe-4S dicluster domain-containing protein [bacterium]|nr:4Fe-4S dicluster domain-containing protein [candidate division CSSED10-310 bacterium]